MKSLFSFFSILSCLSVATILQTAARPQQIKPPRTRQETPGAPTTYCGDIISEVDQGFAYFWAVDAFDCLTSVPFNPAVATRFVSYVNETLQFQSTLAYLKNPPQGYQQQPVDVLQTLQTIQDKITAGDYPNQYAFEAELQLLLYSTHDGHVSLTSGIMAAFSFLAPFSLSSVSADGKNLPQVYVTDDIKGSQEQGWQPSPIKTINDRDTVEYLDELAQINSFGGIEPNADWDQLFTTPVLDIQGDVSILGGYMSFYPGDELNLLFENGTTHEDFWLAVYNEPYPSGPLSTGGDFYNYFVMGLLPASFNDNNTFNAAYSPSTNDNTSVIAEPETPNSWAEASSGAFPDPDIFQPDLSVLGEGVLSGYWLEDSDAAVLSIPTFDQRGDAIGDFSSTVSSFISNASAAGLSRVVIDLQQNTGGTLELAFSTFKRFFPTVDPSAGSRRRSHSLGNILGEAYTEFFDTLDTSDPNYSYYLAREWVITPRLNAATGENFTSWEEYANGVEANQDKFSLIERFNLSSQVFDEALFDGWTPWGYTPALPEDGELGSAAFEAENIVLLTDGACASACAVFMELMIQAGCRTIAVGGRPATGPMQAVGGNRGAASYSADALDYDILDLISGNENVPPSLPPLNEDGYRDSGMFTTYLGVNLRDQIRQDDTVPLQFKYEAADCRIFYTLSNLYNMPRLWKDAIAASFDDPSLCVEGSTGYTGDSPNTPPTPPLIPIPSLDAGTSDGVDTAFSLSGGPQNFNVPSKGARVTFCTNGCDDRRTECRRKVSLSCGGGDDRITVSANLCLPAATDIDNCPTGTTYRAMHTLPNKQTSGRRIRGGKSSPALQATTSGFCFPASGQPLMKSLCSNIGF